MDQPVRNQSESRDELPPIEVAYLRGGAKAAVMAAVAGLHARKAVTILRHGQLAATGVESADDVTPVEQAVLHALRTPTPLGSVRSAGPVRVELHAVDTLLRERGLLSRARRSVLPWRTGRTEAGEGLLSELRDTYRELDPATRPDWSPQAPYAAAMSVALYGAAAMPPEPSREAGPGIRTSLSADTGGI